MKHCQHCGTQNQDEVAFCRECGKPLTVASAPAVKVSAAKTILATAPPILTQQQQTAPIESTRDAPGGAAKVQDSKRTILGMSPLVVGRGASPATPATAGQPPQGAIPARAAKARAPEDQPQPGQQAPSAATAQQTAPLPQSELLDDKTRKAAQEAAGKTILGVSPLVAAAAAAARPDGASPISSVSPSPHGPLQQVAPPSAMGQRPAPNVGAVAAVKGGPPLLEPLVEEPVAARDAQRPAKAQAVAPAERTNLQKGDLPRAPSAKAAPFPPYTNGQPTRISRLGATTMLIVRKTAAVPRWLLVLIALVVIVGATLGVVIKKYVLEPMRPCVVGLKIEQAPDFVSINITANLKNVEKVASLKILDRTFKIEKNRAILNLPIGPVRLGSNSIEAIMMDAKGQEKGTLPIKFELTKYWQPQTQTLDSEPPLLGIYFQTLPDAMLLIDGQPSPGEGPGKFLYQKPIKELLGKAPPATGDIWEIPFDYEIRGSKGTKREEGKIKVAVPTVRLQVDRPADGARVAEAAVECTGKTDPDAEVKINGVPTKVHAGRFATQVPLPQLGRHEIKVEAVSSKRGPRVAVVVVERVGDMKEEIEAFKKGVETGLTWEKLARDPVSYTGKRVAFWGRIFNIRTEKGVTAFQMLVSDGCPEGARCTLVATFRGETSAGEQSLATVLGEVTGMQTLETASGAKFDVPKIEAKYVLPEGPKQRKKK